MSSPRSGTSCPPRPFAIRILTAILLLAVFACLHGCGGGGGGGSIATGGGSPSSPGGPSTAGISLLAGGLGGPGNIDGVGIAARFVQASTIALDAAGNIYLSDSPITYVRKVTPDAVVTTLTGQAAQNAMPVVRAMDAAGNVYAAHASNSTITRTTPAGVTSIFAGSPGVLGHADGIGAVATFARPAGVVVDAVGNVFVADTDNCTIRKITPAGVVTTLAGKAAQDCVPVDGNGANARFDLTLAIVIDQAGSMYVTGRDKRVRKVTQDGTVSTLAGSTLSDEAVDGTGALARFSSTSLPLAIDAAGNLYTSDNTTVRRITPAGVVTTIAGAARQIGNTDGTGAAARLSDQFTGPWVATADTLGNIYVQERFGGIRKVTAVGVVTTVSTSRADQLQVFAVAPGGDLYVTCPVGADGAISNGFANAVCKMAPNGAMNMLPGTFGLHSFQPRVDANGNVYAIDADNLSVRKFAPDGQSNTLLRLGNVPGSGNYCPNFDSITVDSARNVFVSNNRQIFRIGADGAVSLFAGWTELPCFVAAADLPVQADGLGSAARFSRTGSMATDADGNLYVVDVNTLRKITPTGVVTTVAGQPEFLGVKLGPLPGSFYSPSGLVFLPGGAGTRFATFDENSVLLVTLP